MSRILQNLNEKQIEAVTHFTGPLLVYAGAGSGKTSALTHRIAYLIEEKFINPWNILAVTFTNKAANEMKQRLVKLLGREEAQDSNMPTVGTFHNICVRILRKEIHLLDFENTFAIYDIVDQQILIKRIMEELFMDIKKLNPKAVLAHISNAKSQLLTHEEYANYANDFFSEKVAQIYLRYQAALRRNNALDFDDLIMKTVELFKKFPDVLDRYQEKFRFISVDEYQDTNKSQYIFIKMLAEKYQNLCVIGDSDQSIYSWRGATIQNILDFEKDYPGAKVVLLEQNYRSTQVILDAANMVIARNMQRREKKLWTEKQGGEKISQWLCDNERHEAEMILREIKSKIVGSEYPVYNDFVILYRTNAQSRVFEEAFLRHAIPYRIVGGIKFYDRKEVKDILAYLRIVQNPSDSVSLLRIINTPTRKIGDKTLLCVEDFARKHEISVFNAMLLADEIEEIPAAKKKAIEDFAKIIKELQILNAQSPASAMIKYVLDKTGYKKMVDDGSVEGEARLENISELVTVAYKYDRLENGMSLNIFLEEVSLISDLDSIEDKDNAVTLMTAHAAKGLEFQYVFVAGLEDGVFPHSRSLMDREELEEERRLMYVAMTRAKEKLYLLHSQTRMLYGEAKSNAPSQFLADINDELVERNFGQHSYRGHISIASIENRPVPIELDAGFETDLGQGDRVTHGIFGQGIVIDITGGVITVAFEDSKVGVKKLALSIAPLKRV
ncbi:UvrD-helicase domain-containing protein [Candidatus Peregrinibacteria bacterium]|nr:UvrD-helicase domain-containing protein [Candidatus Peregrinibacteria bacterium]